MAIANLWPKNITNPILDTKIILFDFYFRHIEYPIYTAVAVTEMDFERIDINQCPKGRGK